jgi:hypothetical protein
MSKAKTPADREKAKAEPTIAIRPRVGSALARVRRQVDAAGGNMTVVIHDLAERHETEIVAAVTGTPEVVDFD